MLRCAPVAVIGNDRQMGVFATKTNRGDTRMHQTTATSNLEDIAGEFSGTIRFSDDWSVYILGRASELR